MDELSHLKQASKVSSRSTKSWAGVIIGGSVAVMVLGFSLWGSHHKKSAPAPILPPKVDTILDQNEKRLKDLQLAMPEGSNLLVARDDKAMMARRNAPTTMFHGESGDFPDQKTTVTQSKKMTHPDHTIAEGEFIHATLETAMNSDLPGEVRAVVRDPVYAYTGQKILIPEGSRLIGEYNAAPSNGSASERIFVMWTRIITPAGITIDIQSSGTDALGRAGMASNAKDSHFFQIFGTAALLSIMGATANTVGVSSSDQPNSADAYRQSIAGSFSQSAQSSLGQNMSIKPTLHVYQGAAINVFVARDVEVTQT
jgi:type IV secretory pathway VirB10-like protein